MNTSIMELQMKRVSWLLLLVGVLVSTAVSQSVPASSGSPTSVAPAAANPAAPSFSSPVVPQKADAPKPADDDAETIATFRKRVDEVNVIFTVTDKHGHFIKDLKKDDFSVIDDKRPADAIRNFSAQTNLPLRVGLLVDASNSIRDRFKFEQEAAIEFLNQIIRPNYDKAFVVGFDATPEVTQD